MINQESKSRLVLSKNAVWIFTTWREGGTCKETLSLIDLIYTECIFLQLSDSDALFSFLCRICTYKNEAKCGPLKNVKKKPIVIEVDPCNENQCQLPFCYCSRDGDIGPLDEEPQYLPQLMMLTFDGAVNLNNFPKYKTLLGMKHGNGSNACPIRGTFFVKNDYNDYSMIQELYYLGNEMAVEGVTGRSLQYENLTIWKEELEGMRDLLEKLANVPAKDILGIRAPSLKPGFNDQYQV